VHARQPYIENEVKIRYEGPPAEARALIEGCGYHLIQPRTLESDIVFDREGELRGSGQLLRLRREGQRSLVTFKGPVAPGRHKSREEIEFDVSDSGALERVLGRLGYRIAFRYEKYRTTFKISDEPGLITLDETPIGVFLELEGPPEWVDATAARLGQTSAEYLTASYAKLYEEYRRLNPNVPVDMRFEESGPSRTPGK
jgi:adenylate cyclase, class 2